MLNDLASECEDGRQVHLLIRFFAFMRDEIRAFKSLIVNIHRQRKSNRREPPA